MAAARKVLQTLSVELHPQKTRIVHVAQGFEFLGFKIKRGKQLRLPPGKIKSQNQSGAMYAYPKEKSIRRSGDLWSRSASEPDGGYCFARRS